MFFAETGEFSTHYILFTNSYDRLTSNIFMCKKHKMQKSLFFTRLFMKNMYNIKGERSFHTHLPPFAASVNRLIFPKNHNIFALINTK